MKCVSDNPFLNCSGGIPSLLEEALQHDQDYGYGGIGIRVGARSLLASARNLAAGVRPAVLYSAYPRRSRKAEAGDRQPGKRSRTRHPIKKRHLLSARIQRCFYRFPSPRSSAFAARAER